MPRALTGRFRGLGKPRINRGPSATLAISLPWLLVMLGSVLPNWPMIASGPVLPPLGFILLVAWQQLRPGLFPVWAGLPLGLFDDLHSGQPFGSAVVLWSATMILLDLVETSLPWRGVALNWGVASVVISLYLVFAARLADAAGGHSNLLNLGPQVLLSLLAYPVAAMVVGTVDRLRLIPIRKL